MKITSILCLSLTALTLAVVPVHAQTSAANSTPDQVEANYTKAIEGRTDAILKALALDDAAKTATVHDAIIAQYRALKAWHEENDPKLKTARNDTNAVAQIRTSLKSLHADFLAKLGAVLTPDQVETVKDKMTYGKVQFTYRGYLNQYPELTDEQKAHVLELLKLAREDAMDGGSADEKTAVFQKYKGKINNYLSHQGLHPIKPGAAHSGTNAPAAPVTK